MTNINSFGGVLDIKPNSKIYTRWQRMLERASGIKYKQSYPTYSQVTVSNSFKLYSNFEKWIVSQDNYNEYINGGRKWGLDKDLLYINNKIYSEETCCLLPSEINVTIVVNTNKLLSKGIPSGISYQPQYKKYMVTITYCSVNKNLGRYSDIFQAYAVYCDAKNAKVKELAYKWKDYISTQSYLALLNYSECERSGFNLARLD